MPSRGTTGPVGAQDLIEHPCGLFLTPGEAEALDAVPPAKVVFDSSDGHVGDVILDVYNVGWYARGDADKAADYWGTVVIETERNDEYVPSHPRRETEDDL